MTTKNKNQATKILESIKKSDMFKPTLDTRIREIHDMNTDFIEFMDSVVTGLHGSVVLYGPPGMGKTHGVMSALNRNNLEENKDYIVLRSHTTAMSLYTTLYKYRAKGKFVVLDDCDGILQEERGLNILKAATDPKFRDVGWNTSTVLGLGIPTKFTFNGTIIITTNVALARGKSRLANHWDAIRSRCAPFMLALEHREEQFAQMFYMMTETDYLKRLNQDVKAELLKFFLDNLDRPRRIDLRLPEIIARELTSGKANWQGRARRILDSV